MQINFEFVIYNEEQDEFELDENIYSFTLNEEQAKTYELLKSADLHLYNWFKESQFFQKWLQEEIYQDKIGRKIAICDIDNVSFRRYYFFKVTSSDNHYEYFKKLFNIFHEVDWQDREDVGAEILKKLAVKREELLIELVDNSEDNEGLSE